MGGVGGRVELGGGRKIYFTYIGWGSRIVNIVFTVYLL